MSFCYLQAPGGALSMWWVCGFPLSSASYWSSLTPPLIESWNNCILQLVLSRVFLNRIFPFIFLMQGIVKWGTSWRHFWADIPSFSNVYQGRGWVCLLSWPRGCYRTSGWEGRKRGKRQDGKKGFSVEWVPALTNGHPLNCTQPVLSLVLCSHQRMLRVSRKMNRFFPLLTTLLSYEGSLTRPSLPRSWQVKEWVELAHFFWTGRSQEEKQQQRVGVPALQMLLIFLHWH